MVRHGLSELPGGTVLQVTDPGTYPHPYRVRAELHVSECLVRVVDRSVVSRLFDVTVFWNVFTDWSA